MIRHSVATWEGFLRTHRLVSAALLVLLAGFALSSAVAQAQDQAVGAKTWIGRYDELENSSRTQSRRNAQRHRGRSRALNGVTWLHDRSLRLEADTARHLSANEATRRKSPPMSSISSWASTWSPSRWSDGSGATSARRSCEWRSRASRTLAVCPEFTYRDVEPSAHPSQDVPEPHLRQRQQRG